jgi:hypothetical protein
MDFDDEAENSQDEAENSQLTHKQGMEYFQQAYNKSVKCYGKKKTSPKEHYIADMLRDIGITRDVDVKAILTLIGKMQKYNAFKQYVMNIMEFPTPKSQMKRKISFLAGQKVKGLVSTIPIEMLNILIVQPVQNPHVQQTMEVMIEEPGNNNSGNAVNDVDNNDEAMDIVPPLVLSLAHSVNTMCKGIRVNAGHYLDSIFDQKLVLRSLAYCQDAWRTTSCNILVQNSSRCVSCSTYYKHRNRNDCKLHKKRLDMNQVIHEEICTVIRIQDKVYICIMCIYVN